MGNWGHDKLNYMVDVHILITVNAKYYICSSLKHIFLYETKMEAAAWRTQSTKH
jgi:hypothetical protein